MNSTADRLTTPAILPSCTIGGTERRDCAVLALPGGATLALQATCLTGDRSGVTVFSARRPAGGADWEPMRVHLVDHPVPAAPAPAVTPLLRDAATIVWPLEDGSHLVLDLDGTGPGSVIPGPPSGGRIAAFCAGTGSLFAALAPATGPATGPDTGPAAILHRTVAGDWQPFAPAGLPAPGAVTALAVFAGHLHAAVADAQAGFSLWRAPEDGSGAWQAVMTRGGWRYGYNPAVTAMAVAGGHLLVAAGGADTHQVANGDEHPELFAITPDGGWDLFSGQARFSPDGLRRPRTEGGPGTPRMAEFVICGLSPQDSGDILVWMALPDPDEGDPLVLCRWSAATGAWSEERRIAQPAMTVTTLVALPDGGLLMAGGGEMAPGPWRPLLVALAPA